MYPPSPPPVIAPPGSGRTLKAFGDEVTVLLSGAQTGGAFAMMQIVTPPGGGPPPHYHKEEDEWFFVQEGRVEFFVNGVWHEVAAGSSIFAPRGSEHTYRNTGESPLRMLVHAAPSGFEIFFERCAGVFNQPGGPDMARILDISAEHGIFYLDAGKS